MVSLNKNAKTKNIQSFPGNMFSHIHVTTYGFSRANTCMNINVGFTFHLKRNRHGFKSKLINTFSNMLLVSVDKMLKFTSSDIVHNIML